MTSSINRSLSFQRLFEHSFQYTNNNYFYQLSLIYPNLNFREGCVRPNFSYPLKIVAIEDSKRFTKGASRLNMFLNHMDSMRLTCWKHTFGNYQALSNLGALSIMKEGNFYRWTILFPTDPFSKSQQDESRLSPISQQLTQPYSFSMTQNSLQLLQSTLQNGMQYLMCEQELRRMTINNIFANLKEGNF